MDLIPFINLAILFRKQIAEGIRHALDDYRRLLESNDPTIVREGDRPLAPPETQKNRNLTDIEHREKIFGQLLTPPSSSPSSSIKSPISIYPLERHLPPPPPPPPPSTQPSSSSPPSQSRPRVLPPRPSHLPGPPLTIPSPGETAAPPKPAPEPAPNPPPAEAKSGDTNKPLLSPQQATQMAMILGGVLLLSMMLSSSSHPPRSKRRRSKDDEED